MTLREVVKTVGTWTSILLHLIWYFLLSVFYSCLSGMIVFLVLVVVMAFLAWLFESTNPRDVAKTVGALGGVMWVLGETCFRVSVFIGKFREELQKERIRKIMDSDD